MNRDDIYKLARDAWLMDKHDCSDDWFVRADIDERNVIEFAALVAAAERESMKADGWRSCAVGQRTTQHCGLLETAVLVEREACARVCEGDGVKQMNGDECAAAIRARGEVETKTPDYLEKCPNCNGPADNGFDRSWPDPNPYFCTKCMKAMEY